MNIIAKLRSRVSRLNWFQRAILLILPPYVIWCSVHLYLDLTPPADRPEHRYLLTLFPDNRRETYSFKRLDRLSDRYFFVATHGIGNQESGVSSITDERTDAKKSLLAKELADIIVAKRKRLEIDDALPIFLMACNAGAGKQPFAQTLSDELGVAVRAPTQWLIVDHFGWSRTGSNILTAYFNFGEFSSRTFYPTLATKKIN